MNYVNMSVCWVTIAILGCSAAAPTLDDGATEAAIAASPAAADPVVQERNELFMLAAMSHAYAGKVDTFGYDISALIAWNVADPAVTPAFVIDRNRNYEKQGDIHHAEINTLRSAYERTRDFDVAPRETGKGRYERYANDLKTAWLYTTLEPCPMCATTITMAKIPVAHYCMEDPGLRHAETHQTVIEVPTKFYGRELRQDRSPIPVCAKANDEMWKAFAEAQRDGGDPDRKRFSITTYLTDNAERVFRPAWKQLACWEVRHEQNRELLAALRRATGATDCQGGPAR